MKILKKYTISTPLTTLRPNIFELLDDAQGSSFTWPSAELLSTYLVCNRAILEGKAIIELGAGTALPSIVSALCGARKVLATDRMDEPELYEIINESIVMNSVGESCLAVPLDWDALESSTESFDIILGSDIFYNPEDFPKVFTIVDALMRINPSCVFITAYHQRDSTTTIRNLLESFRMTAQLVAKEDYLHHAHALGECLVINTAAQSEVEEKKIVSYDDIFIIIIKRL